MLFAVVEYAVVLCCCKEGATKTMMGVCTLKSVANFAPPTT